MIAKKHGLLIGKRLYIQSDFNHVLRNYSESLPMTINRIHVRQGFETGNRRETYFIEELTERYIRRFEHLFEDWSD